MARYGLILGTVCALALFAAPGCGDDDAPVNPPECEQIAERCHELDPGSGPIHECHEFAESGHTAAECTAMQAECFAACVEPSDGGGGTDAGGGSDGG